MADPKSDEEQPLDPAAARLMSRVRWMMAISGFATLLGIAVILGVIGYRVFKSEGSAAPAETVALLPKTAKILNIAVAQDRIVVTLDVAGALEIRSFDLHTLKAAGRMKFASEP